MIAQVALFDTIRTAQNKNCEAMLLLLEQFEPILNKYARKLHLDYDDAKQELALAFIELVKSIKLSNLRDSSNKSIVPYIAKSIHNAYIRISTADKKLSKEISLDDLESAWEAHHFYKKSVQQYWVSGHW